jgi:signal transduction histidine kinase
MDLSGHPRLSTPKAVSLSLILLAAVLWIDHATGELSVTLLYLVPVGIASWFSGRKSAFVISLLAVLGWFWMFYRIYFYRRLVPTVWDCCITFGIFLLFSHVLFKFRTARDSLKRSADRLEAQVEKRTSELATANQELRETAERLTMAWQNVPIHMSMVDRNLRYHWLYNRLLPDSGKYIGGGAESFLLPEEAGRLEAAKHRVIQTGRGTREEILFQTGGHNVWFDMLIEPLRNEAGEIEGATTIGIDITERKIAENQLRNLNESLRLRTEQLRCLTFELTRAEEQERRRIAHLLHDDLQQLLVAAKFSLRTAASRTSDGAVVSSLDEIGSLIDQSIAASRSLTAELVPPMLYEKGLPEALRWLAGWIQQKYGIEVILETDEQKQELTQDLLLVLFQSTRELLFNIAKHAQVKRAMVTVCYGGEDISVRVRDEGVGFDPAALETSTGPQRKGFGLIAMQERLATLGGQLLIESAPGHGTVSTINMPVRFDRKPFYNSAGSRYHRRSRKWSDGHRSEDEAAPGLGLNES